MKNIRRSRWTPEQQKRQVGEAMAIATTANLLLGLRRTDPGRAYVDSMVKHGAMDRELCDGGTQYILIPMLPFAVELGLKGIKSQSGGAFLRTHNLKCLWNDLAEDEQAAIRNRVEDPAWRREEEPQRAVLGITDEMRPVDQVIEVHQDDFVHWRYVVDGEKHLTNETAHLSIDEAIMDLYGIAYACIDYYQSRGCATRRGTD